MSRVLGLFREQLFAALFTKDITDAWNQAWKIPNLFRRVLGEGSLSVNFLPVFIEQKQKSLETARSFAAGFFTLLFIFLTVFTVVGVICSADLVRLLVAEFYEQDVLKFERTVYFAKIMFGFIFLMSLYALFMAILNAFEEFFWPAVAPTFFNIAMIVATLLPAGLLPVKGETLAWGVLVGGVLQVLVLLPRLKALGFWPRFSMRVEWGPCRRVLINMGPGLLGTGLMQLTVLINSNFASSLPEGSISYIGWADRLLELPLSLVAVSLGTALLPRLSQLVAEKNWQSFNSTLIENLSLTFYLVLPCALGLYFLALPIVQLLFQYGHFSLSDSQKVAQIVEIYSLILISSSFARVFISAFYASQNTWFPAVASAIALGLHLAVAPRLMNRWGLNGLVFSTFLSGAISFIFLWVGFQVFVLRLANKDFIVRLFKTTLSALPMFGFLLLSKSVYDSTGPIWQRVLHLICAGGIAGATFLFLGHFCKIPEYENTFKKLLRRKRKKPAI